MNSSDTTTSFDANVYRRDFPILATRVHGDRPLVYLDNAATTQRPKAVIQSMVDVYEQHYANVHRGIHWLSDQSTDRYEDARRKVQAFIRAKHVHEIIFTNGTTMSINLVARSWGDAFVSAGDEILVSDMEHHANLVPWQQLSERTGCVIRSIPLTEDGQLDLTTLPELLTPRTRLVAITAVSNVLGTINPLRYIIDAAHQAGALVLVDAAQSVPHMITDVQELQADFLAFSGHKMLGPSGIGVLYGREALLERMPPFLGGGSMIRRVMIDRFEPADLPAKFEAGTPPIVPAIGLGVAIDYLQAIGLERIHAYELELTQRAHQRLAAIEGIRFLGPDPSAKAGIVSFTVERLHAHDIAQLLDRHGIAIRAGHHCTMPLHKRLGIQASSRASFYFYNTPAEIDQLVESLAAAKAVFRRPTKT